RLSDKICIFVHILIFIVKNKDIKKWDFSIEFPAFKKFYRTTMIKNIKFAKKLSLLVLFALLFYSANSQVNHDFYIKTVDIKGNNKTKTETILRELTFSEGDSISKKELLQKTEESKKNLQNTPLFNFVDINILNDSTSNIEIEINVEERWYLWPQIAVYYADRNFSNWIKNRDFTRTDFGAGLEKYNFRGRNEKLSFYSIFGYDEELMLNYRDIFIDKNRQHSIGIFLKQLKRKETGCKIENDKLTQIKLQNEYALKSYSLSVKYSYRKDFYNSHSIYYGFENRKLSDSLLFFSPDYTVNSQTEINYFFLKYIFKRDKRNSRIFPTEGHYIKITTVKNGLFLLPEDEINSFYIKSEFSKYTKLSEKLYLGNHITVKFKANNKTAFFLNSGIGYNSNIRGYEYYVVNGTNFALTKNTLNFKLIPKKVIYLKKIPFKRFNKIHFTVYASIFADAAYVKNSDISYSQTNILDNTLLYSSGLSLNILTYYDALLRLDYSINHLKERGFYLHFEAPF
ncbi:MAG: BamA/TamA family outer membrane protein, partial [Bacteroidales bacterium]|nr:BamA/TamA family outer membrane protein [Bacteroidales bacterium]